MLFAYHANKRSVRLSWRPLSFGTARPSALAVFKIDDEIELGWLLDEKVSRFRAAQNHIDIVAGAPEQIWKAHPYVTSCTTSDARN